MSAFISSVAEALSSPYSIVSYIFRVVLATLLGAVIGWERTKRSKEAGVRTHCIIACASALFMIVSKYGFEDMATFFGFMDGTRGADPSRIAAQVVSGISFLGAGVIFKNGSTVKGLTTAAGIWATSAVGLACGGGLYVISIFVTALIVAVQLIMHRLPIGSDAYSVSEIRVTFVNTPTARRVLKEKSKELGLEVISSSVVQGKDGLMEMVLTVRRKSSLRFEEVIALMDEYPDIRSLSV